MAETIQTKQCSKCKKIKSVSEFAPRCDRPSGLQSWCRQCHKEHRHKPEVAENIRIKANKRRRQPKYRKHRKEYQKTAKAKIWIQEYREKNREHLNTKQKKYNKTATANGKNKQRAKKYAKENPEKVRCLWAIKYAVKSGKIPKITKHNCFYCGKKAQNYHHWHGYDKAHTYDIIPLCIKCHKFVHKALVPCKTNIGHECADYTR